jgi:ACS family D-galactonate transporter-like MFS transporter
MNSNANVTVSAPSATCNRREFGPEDDALLKWTIIGLLSLGAIIAYVSRSNLAVALTLPSFAHSFGLFETGRGTVNSAFFWTYAALQIPAGWVVDRYGVKWPYALCLLFWCLASAGTCLVTSLDQLILLRLLVGTGEAVSVPASARWIRMNFPERRRGLAMGLYMTGTKIGPAIGAPLAVWLLTGHSWRSMFFIVGIGGLLWLIPWIWMVKDQRPDRHSTESVRVASPSRLTFGTLVASPVIWGTVIATFAYMYFVYFCLTWMPAYLTEQRHLSLSQMGTYTFFGFGGMAAVAALAGWLADHIIGRGGNPVTVRKCFTIGGFAIAGTELVGAQSSSLTVALTFSIISLSGLGLATANYWALTQTLIPAPAIGRVSGIQNCAASVAGIVAPILTGWLKQRTGSYHAPMFACFAFLLVGVLSYLLMVKSRYAPRPGQ